MSYSGAVLVDKPGVYFRTQEASGLLQDSSGHAHNTYISFGASGGPVGVVTYHVASPILSDPAAFAIGLDGNSAFAVADNVDIDVGDVFTLEFWGKRAYPALTTNQVILDKGGNGSTIGTYQIRLPDSAPTVGLFDVNRPTIADLAVSTRAITSPDTSWHYYVATKNGSTVKLYIDAANVTSSAGSSTCNNSTMDLNIGCDQADSAFWTGSLAEIAVYGTALTQERIQVHYNLALLPIQPGDDPSIGFLGRGAGW